MQIWLSLFYCVEKIVFHLNHMLYTCGLAKDGMPAGVGCGVDDGHGGLVAVDVVALAERVHDVQLQVGEGGQRRVHLGGKLQIEKETDCFRSTR